MAPPPLIAVSPNELPAEDRRLYKGKALEYGEAGLAAAVAGAGGIPLMVYRAGHEGTALVDWADAVIARVDALLLSGGEDVAPLCYGEVAERPEWRGNPERDALELALYRSARAHHKPILGVCRGAQLIAVAEGGSLWQDLASMRRGSLQHRSQELYDDLEHALEIDPSATFLAKLFTGEETLVNSVHHQGIRVEPRSLRVVARAPDGVVEAFVCPDAWVLGVQWHPEWMQRRASQRRLLELFIGAARGSSELPW